MSTRQRRGGAAGSKAPRGERERAPLSRQASFSLWRSRCLTPESMTWRSKRRSGSRPCAAHTPHTAPAPKSPAAPPRQQQALRQLRVRLGKTARACTMCGQRHWRSSATSRSESADARRADPHGSSAAGMILIATGCTPSSSPRYTCGRARRRSLPCHAPGSCACVPYPPLALALHPHCKAKDALALSSTCAVPLHQPTACAQDACRCAAPQRRRPQARPPFFPSLRAVPAGGHADG